MDGEESSRLSSVFSPRHVPLPPVADLHADFHHSQANTLRLLFDGPFQFALRNPTRMLDAPVGSLVVAGLGGHGSHGAKGQPQVDLTLRVPLPWHVLDSLLSKPISTAFIELYD